MLFESSHTINCVVREFALPIKIYHTKKVVDGVEVEVVRVVDTRGSNVVIMFGQNHNRQKKHAAKTTSPIYICIIPAT